MANPNNGAVANGKEGEYTTNGSEKDSEVIDRSPNPYYSIFVTKRGGRLPNSQNFAKTNHEIKHDQNKLSTIPKLMDVRIPPFALIVLENRFNTVNQKSDFKCVYNENTRQHSISILNECGALTIRRYCSVHYNQQFRRLRSESNQCLEENQCPPISGPQFKIHKQLNPLSVPFIPKPSIGIAGATASFIVCPTDSLKKHI